MNLYSLEETVGTVSSDGTSFRQQCVHNLIRYLFIDFFTNYLCINVFE